MKNKRIKSGIIIIVFAFMLVLSLFAGQGVTPAFAETSNFSSVLADLQKDSNFNFADYPENSKDYSIQVIQIAESETGNLYLYTYQPCQNTKKLVATEINMSLTESVDGTKLYGLNRVSTWGVFAKYLVTGVKVSSNDVRYYNISSIYRLYDSSIDKAPSSGQVISAVSNKVAQIWTVEEKNNSVIYSVLKSEVITITQKVVGFCIYDDGLQLGWGQTEGITKAYFVAFSTDRQIDKLISADLTFYATRAHCKICLNRNHKDHGLFYDFHDPEYIDYGTGVYNDEPLTIFHTEKFSNQGGGNVRPANKYTWNRIRSTSAFIADNNNEEFEIISDGEKSLSGTQWVLNFYEAQDKYKTDNVWLSFIPGVSQIKGINDGDCELNNVYDVSILRLEFETDGKTYNLGVVDDKRSGNDKPINSLKEKGFWAYIWNSLVKLFTGKAGVVETIVAVLTLVVVVIAVVLAVKFIKFVVNGLFG